MKVTILYEDKDLVVAVKPFGMPSQPDKTGDMDILTYLEHSYKGSKYGEYVGLVHRLDRPVGGVMIFARNKKAEQKLAEEIRLNHVQKEYLTILTGKMPDRLGSLENYLLKNGKTNLSVVVPPHQKGAKKAQLNYTVLESKPQEPWEILSLVKIQLLTGRHHQIRVQCSHAGAGILGDRKYNKEASKAYDGNNIALWSYCLSFWHPFQKQQMCFEMLPKEPPFSLFFS
ncbi:MAG: RluA family pseudouridine synthase [Epulopiscium sp.]|nr:RluA family pseudouridine synthase [Candidatus Epulonipiscium sp.]